MGKRTRKKRQNNHKKKTYEKEETNNDLNSSSSSVLLQRIRHSDPRTRHAALAAVANTLLDPNRPSIPSTVTSTLLQAIRERVLDADLDVCQVAAGCLANYVAHDQSSMHGTTAGWTLVLVGRLKQCYQQLLLAQNNQSKTKKAPSQTKLQKQWLALASSCFRTLCVLVETNPQAVDRLTSTVDATPRQDFHQTLLEWMQQSQHYFSSASTDDFKDYYSEILTLSARTLHSAWDDNAELWLPWRDECPEAFGQALQLLETTLQPSSNIPVVAQLHCMGAFLTAHTPTTDTPTIPQTILPKLTLILNQFSWQKAQSLLQAYQQASEAWAQEQADDALERDVIRTVQNRKEPARNIARRQKAQKEEAKKKKESNNTMQNDNKEDDDDAAMQPDEKSAEEQHQQQVETQQALEQAREAWNEFLLPLQLALELLANLTGASPEGEEDDHEMMMMDDEDWGPDQEAQWMQQQQSSTQQRQSNESLHKLLLESALPQQLKQLFQQVYQVPPTDLVFPEQSRDDLHDLQSKTMAVLGNCWENIPEWPATAVEWPPLQQAATTASGMGLEGLASAMVIALRTFPSVRKAWQPEHVAFWLNQLSTSTSTAVRRDTITMLGILCSQEPHPVEVNQKICSALLSALTTDDSVMISCEVLNVLMDVYGNDEDDGCCHVSVFESLQVLGHFQRSIPTLKTKLKQQEQKGVVDKAEVEQWKETLLNASRFVQYKKGQL